ncbi:MAG: hypothetical protein JXB17_11035 [Bacteroidales bacterium]|nr:hypothetical protein [Bacteroidales bacterium]
MSSKSMTPVVGLVLAILSLGVLLNSSYFFLAIIKLSVGKWLAFNACSLAIIVYLICYVFFRVKSWFFLLAIPLLPLYYYGTMGLFVMPWNQANIFAQITHLVITLNVFWILWVLLKERQFDALGKGLLVGIIVFVPVIACIQSYTQLHMDEFMKVLQGL